MGRQSYKSKRNYNREKGTTETPPHHTPATGGKAILVAHRIEGKGQMLPLKRKFAAFSCEIKVLFLRQMQFFQSQGQT